nr:hypothetical protein CE91St29_08340 [Corynebacterium striatum]
MIFPIESAMPGILPRKTPTKVMNSTHKAAPVTFQPMKWRYGICAVPAATGT